VLKRTIETARNLAAPALVFILVLLLWHAAVVAFSIPAILLPSPTAVLKAAWDQRELLLQAMYTSGLAALCAFVTCGIVGLLIAISFSVSNWVRRAFFPYVIFLQTVPIVAIAPLLIIWSGYNFRTIVLVAVIIGLFPVVSNTTNSLLFVPPLQRDLFRVYSASRWQTLWKLQLPSAIPSWALGMKISSGLVVIGAIVGEFFVGNGGQYDGLGTLITLWQARQYTAGLIAAVAATTVLGLAFFGIAQVLGRNVLAKWTRGKL
jgi:NitT/TauT family transport system permease protein